jgi:dimeric dUTPase (all-alpha-NTP-PPase superfamily)
MGMILSEQTFIELAGKQEVLDAKIKAANNVTELPLRRIELYYRIELAECLNELKGDFKHWSNKPMRREAFIEELVDAMHFYLSFTNHLIADDPFGYLSDEYDDLFNAYDSFKNVREAEQPEGVPLWEIATSSILDTRIHRSFAKILYLAELYNYTEQDIIDTYNRKNAVNHDRSDSGVY